eukprot:Phypoly_transcript_22898.p1 GENE.Phypoly_transcript_22898~~Phypoly_transcript_22898.p1  ORF type:complete len:110 (+),score=6.13 Phypoly_transcript_22898:234-563(+)
MYLIRLLVLSLLLAYVAGQCGYFLEKYQDATCDGEKEYGFLDWTWFPTRCYPVKEFNTSFKVTNVPSQSARLCKYDSPDCSGPRYYCDDYVQNECKNGIKVSFPPDIDC